jgi:hypothetical protein
LGLPLDLKFGPFGLLTPFDLAMQLTTPLGPGIGLTHESTLLLSFDLTTKLPDGLECLRRTTENVGVYY